MREVRRNGVDAVHANVHGSSMGTPANPLRSEGVRVLRDSAWVLTGIFAGTTLSFTLIPTSITIDAGTAVSIASSAAFTMLLSSLRDPSDH